MTEQYDKVFKQWAEDYAQHYGTELLKEQQALDEQGIKYATPRADAQVKKLTTKRKRRRSLPYFAAAAALLILFVGVPAVLVNQGPSLTEVASSSDVATEATVEDAAGNIQQLDFNLPAHYTVEEVLWDNGETIYDLDVESGDDVVLTIRSSEGSETWLEDLDEIIIDNTPVPAKLRDEYKLLTFEHRGTLYTLSCRDDISTLSTLYRSIIDPQNQRSN